MTDLVVKNRNKFASTSQMRARVVLVEWIGRKSEPTCNRHRTTASTNRLLNAKENPFVIAARRLPSHKPDEVVIKAVPPAHAVVRLPLRPDALHAKIPRDVALQRIADTTWHVAVPFAELQVRVVQHPRIGPSGIPVAVKDERAVGVEFEVGYGLRVVERHSLRPQVAEVEDSQAGEGVNRSGGADVEVGVCRCAGAGLDYGFGHSRCNDLRRSQCWVDVEIPDVSLIRTFWVDVLTAGTVE